MAKSNQPEISFSYETLNSAPILMWIVWNYFFVLVLSRRLMIQLAYSSLKSEEETRSDPKTTSDVNQVTMSAQRLSSWTNFSDFSFTNIFSLELFAIAIGWSANKKCFVGALSSCNLLSWLHWKPESPSEAIQISWQIHAVERAGIITYAQAKCGERVFIILLPRNSSFVWFYCVQWESCVTGKFIARFYDGKVQRDDTTIQEFWLLLKT